MSLLAEYFEVPLFSTIRDKEIYLSPANSYYFSVESISKIKKVIDYFEKYPLIGVKGLDSKDFMIGYNMILNKEHLTDDGREKLKIIVAGMNRNRKF
jgi:hypothetical protein